MTVAAEAVRSQPDRVTRAPSDVLRLVVAVVSLVVLILLGVLFGDTIVGFVADLLRGLDALPAWLVTTLVALGQVLGLLLLVVGIGAALVRRAWLLIGSVILGAGVAVVLFALLLPLIDDTSARIAEVNETYTLIDPDRTMSAAALAAITATVAVAGPWVPRRWRQAAWSFLLIEATIHFLGNVVGFDTAIAVLSGWAAGSAVVVAIGAPSRRPTASAIAAGLAAVGVPLAELEPASVDARGSTPYFGTRTDGSKLFVKALGEDERSADLMFRMYRKLQPRNLGDEKSFSSLRRAVEHEALVALAARDIGVRTPRLVAFASAEPDGYVLAYEAIAGRSLDRIEAAELTDEVLGAVWAQLALLRQHRIAHRDLRLANVFLADDGSAWIIDFGFSELAVSDLLLATDLAELLASSAAVVGVDRAVALGETTVGAAALTSALDRLELPRLSGATRTAMKQQAGLLDALRTRVAGTSGMAPT